MKRLILMRHAKSDWSQGGLTDFERPLSKRGVKDASKMGKWMAQNLEMPEIILCSTARRTQQTLQLLLLALRLEEADYGHIIEQHLESMYLSSAANLRQLVHSHLNRYESLMMIAHNPGLDGLLSYYCPNAPLTSSGKLMTTANIAVIEFDDLLNASLITLQRPGEL